MWLVHTNFSTELVPTKNSRHQKHQNKIFWPILKGGSSTPSSPISPATPPPSDSHLPCAPPHSPLGLTSPLRHLLSRTLIPSPLWCLTPTPFPSEGEYQIFHRIWSCCSWCISFQFPRFSRQSSRPTISGIFPTGMQSLALLNWMASRYMHPQNLISSMSPEDVTAREIVTKDNAFLAYSAFWKVTVQVQS